MEEEKWKKPMKWLIDHQDTVQYDHTVNKKNEVEWRVYKKKTKEVIATGKTLLECLTNATKK